MTLDKSPVFYPTSLNKMTFLFIFIKNCNKELVLFTVKKDGSIDNIEVIRSVCHELDEEAVRVVKLFPDFIPGTINGKPVDCKYTLPIVFRLQ